MSVVRCLDWFLACCRIGFWRAVPHPHLVYAPSTSTQPHRPPPHTQSTFTHTTLTHTTYYLGAQGFASGDLDADAAGARALASVPGVER